MPRRLPNLANQAANFARAADAEFDAGRSGLARARDSMAGLHSALHAPVPTGGSRYSKSTRSSPSLVLRAAEAGFGNALNSGLKNSGSFYTSAAQSASSLMEDLTQVQRIS